MHSSCSKSAPSLAPSDNVQSGIKYSLCCSRRLEANKASSLLIGFSSWSPFLPMRELCHCTSRSKLNNLYLFAILVGPCSRWLVGVMRLHQTFVLWFTMFVEYL
ncbi:hypothetical protein AVEN_185938-1 [Araneus ventricosus]|uniref:Uncharacterized protein n=1 Tax=Araneus ventricosus TaxID=182803 RepID=A0A4Y2JDK3_ARAVE|nr:hypothetical protein AVEN_185938-1 [Araneus ventricosus]